MCIAGHTWQQGAHREPAQKLQSVTTATVTISSMASSLAVRLGGTSALVVAVNNSKMVNFACVVLVLKSAVMHQEV